jgi:perosamine synthetase
MKKELNLYEPYLDKLDLKYINKAIKTKWVSTSGSHVDSFENAISKFTKAKYSLALNSGTSSLHLALKCVGVKKNDAVLVPTTTFIAPINAVLYNNAEPIFFDVDNYLNLNVDDVILYLKTKTEKIGQFLISKKTKKKITALIVVHVFGRPANILKLLNICKKYRIKIIEDASESLGSFILTKKNKIHTGLLGDIGCISFNGNKIITSGSGGMIITDNKTYYKKALYYSSQSKNDPIFFKHNSIGYNYRMNNLEASLGLSQIKKIKKILKKKERDYLEYHEKFKSSDKFEILGKQNQTICNNWLNILIIKKRINKFKFSKIIEKFHKSRIFVRPLWYPNHLQKHLNKFEKFNIKNINNYMNNVICLPSSYNLSKKNIKHVVDFIKRIKI